MQSNFVCLCRFFFENLSILRANEIKINGIIPLCIGPQDCRSRASRGGLTLSQPLGQIMLPDYYFPPPGVSDLPAALGRPQLASTIDTSQDESECLRGRRPPQHIDALYQNLVWFQGRPKAALPCPVCLIDFSFVTEINSLSRNRSKGLFQRLQTKHCM